jgi:hypothetical protein
MKSKLCSIEGCERASWARGWCGMHYDRWHAHGDPMFRTRNANGEGGKTKHGYVTKKISGVFKFEHVRIAESLLGRSLPAGAVVHHVNEDRSDNRAGNLVICPSRAYHALIHRRMRAKNACGNPDWVKCTICKEYDSPENISGERVRRHLACRREMYAALREGRE